MHDNKKKLFRVFYSPLKKMYYIIDAINCDYCGQPIQKTGLIITFFIKKQEYKAACFLCMHDFKHQKDIIHAKMAEYKPFATSNMAQDAHPVLDIPLAYSLSDGSLSVYDEIESTHTDNKTKHAKKPFFSDNDKIGQEIKIGLPLDEKDEAINQAKTIQELFLLNARINAVEDINNKLREYKDALPQLPLNYVEQIEYTKEKERIDDVCDKNELLIAEARAELIRLTIKKAGLTDDEKISLLYGLGD